MSDYLFQFTRNFLYTCLIHVKDTFRTGDVLHPHDFFKDRKNLATAALLKPRARAADVASGVLDDNSGFLLRKSFNERTYGEF